MKNVAIAELVFILAGAIFAIVAIVLWRRTYYLLSKGLKTEGTVVDIETSNDRENGRKETSYYPVIKYQVNDDNWVTKKYFLGTTPSQFKEGDKVILYYDPNDYEKFTLNNNSLQVFVKGMIFAACLFFLGAVVFNFLR